VLNFRRRFRGHTSLGTNLNREEEPVVTRGPPIPSGAFLREEPEFFATPKVALSVLM